MRFYTTQHQKAIHGGNVKNDRLTSNPQLHKVLSTRRRRRPEHTTPIVKSCAT
jgi:hypothetical protein